MQAMKIFVAIAAAALSLISLPAHASASPLVVLPDRDEPPALELPAPPTPPAQRASAVATQGATSAPSCVRPQRAPWAAGLRSFDAR